MAIDPYWSNVVLNLRFEGADGSTSFVDDKGNTVTPTGATISTAHFKYGSSSGYFHLGTYITAATTAIEGSTAFTLEKWVYPTATIGDDRCIYETRGGSGWVFFINSSGYLQVYDSIAGLQAASSVQIPVNTDTHIALERTIGSSYVTYYVNGTAAGGFTLASFATATQIRIGARADGAAAYNGYLDDYRVTIGVARYGGNFTPAPIWDGISSVNNSNFFEFF